MKMKTLRFNLVKSSRNKVEPTTKKVVKVFVCVIGTSIFMFSQRECGYSEVWDILHGEKDSGVIYRTPNLLTSRDMMLELKRRREFIELSMPDNFHQITLNDKKYTINW